MWKAGTLLVVLLACACDRAPRPVIPSEADHTRIGLVDTVAAYHTAISDYILAMDTTAAPLPDTMYIGRHMDFPRIELPGVMAGRTVRVVEPGEVEQEKHVAPFAFLNVFATMTPDEVEFFVVRFGQGLRHRTDGADDRHLYYRVGEGGELVLERVGR